MYATAAATSLAHQIAKRAEILAAERSEWDTFHQELANYCAPRKAQITEKNYNPSTENHDQLYDSTAVQANLILARGQASLLTPQFERWCSYTAPHELRGRPGVDEWYAEVTRITLQILAKSNFYGQLGEVYLNRGCFGTACISCEEGKNSPLNFRSYPVGTFSIAEDDESYVDTVYREFRLTLRQLVQQFGLESLSPQLSEAWASNDPTAPDRKYEVIHAVYPRNERNPDSPYAWDLPIASVHIEKRTKHLLRESGYQENPFAVSRFLRWGDEKYGWSPAWAALPDARQLNYLQKNIDALVDILIRPRLLIPSNLSGEIDLRPAGVTVFDANNPNALPREWGATGRVDFAMERVAHRQENINRSFHVDLFQLFGATLRDQPQMTAREVAERAGEKLWQFSPTYNQMTSELFDPLLRRVFAVLMRGGFFPQPPPSLLQQTESGYMIPDPDTEYNTPIARAIKEMENRSLGTAMQDWLPVSEQHPEIWDNMDMDRAFRDSTRNSGMPEEWKQDPRAVAAMRQQRAEAQQQQEQAQLAEQYGKAARNASGADPDKLKALLQ